MTRPGRHLPLLHSPCDSLSSICQSPPHKSYESPFTPVFQRTSSERGKPSILKLQSSIASRARKAVQVVFRKLPAEQSPTHNLMVNILGSFAEFERELILDRTRRGGRHKVEVRKQFLGGLAPYGFRYVEEATIVRQMFEWVDKQGLSSRKIVQRLSSMNAPPRKKGKRWGKSSVLRILRSETYAGVWHYNKHEGCELSVRQE
jgi:Recombinase/Resolvase, N terminal domain